ncbi:hypothetical protein [Streptomyces sp. NPDC050287]|uniref:hypothetical protein n=1 Tax=Streptomyces sp. NPDC050287 TaxID=3365608 RepID=UPI0037B25243
MTARPPLPVRLLSSALAAGALLAASACSDVDSGAQAADGTASPVVEGSPFAEGSLLGRSAASLVAKPPSPSASGRLTEAGARAALVTEADIEDDWTKVSDAASWRDKLLVGKVDVADFLTAKSQAADCQRLLDALYGDDLLGKPAGASALEGFQQDDSRLLYQVASYDRATLDASLNWLKSLQSTCDEFTATDSAGGKRTVQVTEASVPKEGDARQGLHVTVQGTAADAPATLTLDIAVVRVGNDAITVTAGGLDGGEADSVEQAVRQGTPRLKDVQAGRTPAATPSEVD